MRKSKIKFTELSEKILDGLSAQPDKFFVSLTELDVKVPEWSKLILVALFSKKKVMEVIFFEEAKEFFLSYTKKVLRFSGNVTCLCFSREQGPEWKLFTPPTLIGTNLKTKLRKR